jgi:DNA polymerase
MILYGDTETYSAEPIRNGHYKYAENAEVLLYTYALDDGPVRVVDFTLGSDAALDAMELEQHVADADETVFQNSMFDRAVLWARAPHLCPPLAKWRDTYVQALAHSLPGGLEKLCEILNVDLDKRKLAAGKQLIQLFCKPRPVNSKIRRATRETHPTEWRQFVEYAVHDVEAMRVIHRKLPTWNYSGAELALWHLDQRVNDRGFAIDVDLAAAAIRTAEREQKRLATRTQELTNYDAETGEGVASATQRDRLLEHILLAHGVALPDMTADTLERRLVDEDLPQPVRELINIRLQAAAASVSKYKAMLRSVCRDGRIRGSLQFDGAMRTGRWAGRLVQPQNFMRTPKYLAKEVELAAGAIASDAVDLVYDKPMEVLSAGVPWAITAPKGKKLVAADLSNIEGRVLAWLAGEDWKLQAFREQDADPDNKAKDLYVIGYAKSFRMRIEDVVADHEAGGDWRQIGKVQELALGYQGAVGAFVSMAGVYRIDLEKMAAQAVLEPQMEAKAQAAWRKAEEQKRTLGLSERVYKVCWAFTQLWRRANPKIVQLWRDLEDAARAAIRLPDNVYPVGRLEFGRVANWLRVRLPSGRFLCYPSPRVDDETGQISYMGVNQYTRRWQRIPTYGGKIAENIDQAISRDVMADRMPVIESAGYEIVMHVHDEVVAEVPEHDELLTFEGLAALLATNPSWATGLPLAAAGFESHRYRKD